MCFACQNDKSIKNALSLIHSLQKRLDGKENEIKELKNQNNNLQQEIINNKNKKKRRVKNEI